MICKHCGKELQRYREAEFWAWAEFENGLPWFTCSHFGGPDHQPEIVIDTEDLLQLERELR